MAPAGKAKPKPLLNVQAPVAWQKSVLATLDTGFNTGFSPIDTSRLKSPLRATNINMISDLEIGSPIDSFEVEITSPLRAFSINLASDDDAAPGSPINPSDLRSPLRATSITMGPALSIEEAKKQSQGEHPSAEHRSCTRERLTTRRQLHLRWRPGDQAPHPSSRSLHRDGDCPQDHGRLPVIRQAHLARGRD